MTFTVQCPSCSSTFPVDPAKVPEQGVNARCSACASVFFVERPPAEEDQGRVAPSPEPGEAEPRAEEEGWGAAAGSMDVDTTEMEVDTTEGEGGGGSEPGTGAGPEDWVLERDETTDFGSVDVEPMETVESSQQDDAFFGGGQATAEAPPTPEPHEIEGAGLSDETEIEETETAEERGEAPLGEDQPFGIPDTDAGDLQAVEEVEVGVPEGEEPSGEAPETMPEPDAKPAGFQFGKRDPKEKAERLARVLVSDMIMYNPERHARALENDSLREDFEDEIKKSWEEYTEQVGDELAESTSYFTDALNEILAKGDDVFEGSPPL